MRGGVAAIGLAAAAGLAVLAASVAEAQTARATAWFSAHNSKVRLLSDGLAGVNTDAAFLAGVEIQMQPGWKTYWRMPGDTGVPPAFDFAGSDNVAEVQVFYPAPVRMTDKSGDSIGYKTAVTFPVRITAKDTSRPVKLVLAFEYGICRDICVPTEAKLELMLEAEAPRTARDASLADAMRKVPRAAKSRLPSDPIMHEITGGSTAKPAEIVIKTNAEDVFVEAPDGLFLPQPVKRTPSRHGAPATFVVELTKAPDLKDMIGKPIRITATSADGAIETSWTMK